MFCRLLDQAEARKESRAASSAGPEPTALFPADQTARPLVRVQQHRVGRARCSKSSATRSSRSSARSAASDRALGAGQYMKDAALMIVSPALLYRAVGTIGRLPLEGDRKGDLYEYLLGKLNTAGINGQFRTPRHVIRLDGRLARPPARPDIADPACGTGGFLVAVMEYLYRKYTSEKRHPQRAGPRRAGRQAENHTPATCSKGTWTMSATGCSTASTST